MTSLPFMRFTGVTFHRTAASNPFHVHAHHYDTDYHHPAGPGTAGRGLTARLPLPGFGQVASFPEFKPI